MASVKCSTPMVAVLLTIASCGGEPEPANSGIAQFAILELESTFPEAFSYLSHIRELSDGRILAADPTSQVLLRLDFESGVADTIGRHGAGPQEYEGPDMVLPLPGDSTLRDRIWFFHCLATRRSSSTWVTAD
jgi:hypothetical protein